MNQGAEANIAITSMLKLYNFQVQPFLSIHQRSKGRKYGALFTSNKRHIQVVLTATYVVHIIIVKLWTTKLHLSTWKHGHSNEFFYRSSFWNNLFSWMSQESFLLFWVFCIWSCRCRVDTELSYIILGEFVS